MPTYEYAKTKINPSYVETILGLAPGAISIIETDSGNSIRVYSSIGLSAEQENKIKSLFYLSAPASPVLFPDGSMQATAASGTGDMLKATYDPASKEAQIAVMVDIATDANLSVAAQDAISKRHTQNTDTDLDATFEATLEKVANKGAVSGYTPLDASSLVPTVNLGGAGADNTKYLRGDQTWQTPAGGGGDYSLFRYRKQGRYHSGYPLSPVSSISCIANTMWAVPFLVIAGITISKIAISVAASATYNCRLGIYVDDSSVYPGALISDCGTVYCGSTGLKEITGLSIPLSANTLYWLAILMQNAGVSLNSENYNYTWRPIGFSATDIATNHGHLYQVAQAYGVLPSTFPVGATTPIGGNPPRIAVQW